MMANREGEPAMRTIVSTLFFPAALLASLLTFTMARAAGGNLELAAIVPGALTLLLAMRVPTGSAWRRCWRWSIPC